MTSIVLEKNEVEYQIQNKKTTLKIEVINFNCQISSRFPWSSQAKFYQITNICNSKNTHY